MFGIFAILFIVGLFICYKLDKRPGGYYDTMEKQKFENQLEAVKHGASIYDVTKQPEKKASVAKRAAVGAVIAGETGAIIGAASAVNENIKNSDKK